MNKTPVAWHVGWHWSVPCVRRAWRACGVLTDGGCSADSAADARHALVRLATCKYPLRALAWLGLARLAALPPLILHLCQLWPVLHTHASYYLYVYRLVMVHLCSVTNCWPSATRNYASTWEPPRKDTFGTSLEATC